MLAKGWIHLSISLYGASVLFIRKKMGKLRMFIDFRSLNANTRLDILPLLKIADLLDKLGKAGFFSSIDLAVLIIR